MSVNQRPRRTPRVSSRVKSYDKKESVENKKKVVSSFSSNCTHFLANMIELIYVDYFKMKIVTFPCKSAAKIYFRKILAKS